jgi:hypothetical protein
MQTAVTFKTISTGYGYKLINISGDYKYLLIAIIDSYSPEDSNEIHLDKS